MKMADVNNTMRKLLLGHSVQDYISLGAGVLTLVILISYIIYGNVYDYFDVVVFFDFLIASASSIAYFFLSDKAPFRFLNLLSSLALGFGFGFFFDNSFPVWADNTMHITMYASRGGLGPVIYIMVMNIIAMIATIVCCFMNEEKKANKDQFDVVKGDNNA